MTNQTSKIMNLFKKDTTQHAIGGLIILLIMLRLSDPTAALATVCLVAGAKEFGDLENWESWKQGNFKDFMFTIIPAYIVAVAYEAFA